MDEIVVLHRPWLLTFVNSRVQDTELAKDIVQDALLKALLAYEKFRGLSAERTWLASIALNLIRDHRRSTKHRFWQHLERKQPDGEDVSALLEGKGALTGTARR